MTGRLIGRCVTWGGARLARGLIPSVPTAPIYMADIAWYAVSTGGTGPIKRGALAFT